MQEDSEGEFDAPPITLKGDTRFSSLTFTASLLRDIFKALNPRR